MTMGERARTVLQQNLSQHHLSRVMCDRVETTIFRGASGTREAPREAAPLAAGSHGTGASVPGNAP
jgi:hypothetical protein